MSILNRKQLKKLLLKEFKMLGMAPMGGGMIGHSPYEAEAIHDDDFGMEMHAVDHVEEYGHESASSDLRRVSREDCCAAVLCLIECCTCEETKARLRQVCDELMNKPDDSGSCG